MDEEKGIIFTVRNNHAPSCGTPPAVDTSTQGKYCGYFENEHREQFIFEYDYDTKKATLWGGDIGWERPVSVTDPQKPNVVLGKAEWLWLQSCWMAATAFEGKE